MGLVRLTTIVLAVALTAACASSGPVPKPFPGSSEPAPPAAPASPPAPRTNAASIVKDALALRGAPYRNGGSDPKGFDCSGFVQYVFGMHGVKLPRGTREQLEHGIEVRLAAIAPGDLIFFSTTASNEASHVGVAVGGDEFVHAPSSRGVVRVEKFSAPYWSRRIVGVRRLR
jgi:cell wall-associated NlpC family hydrolase